MAPAKARAKTTTTNTGTTRFDAMVAEANRLNDAHLGYSQTNREGPTSYDCSSSCAQLMRTAGYNVDFFNSSSAPSEPHFHPGVDPSGRLTFWCNADHMFATINGHDWGTGGNSWGGPGWETWTVGQHGSYSPYHLDGMDDPASIPAGGNTTTPGGSGSTGGSVSGGLSADDVANTSKAAAFASLLELPGLFDSAESQMLKGSKSLMNDTPLFPFIEQLAQASLRNFMSLPNGDLFAFFPDYFGGLNHRTPYWEIHDIEILDGHIDLSDDALATHVYVVGDTATYSYAVSLPDKVQTGGVVTIFDAFLADFIKGQSPTKKAPSKQPKVKQDNKGKKQANPTDTSNSADSLDTPTLPHDKAVNFLNKYGARPYYEEAPMIRNTYYELFLAYQKFMLMWANQFVTKFEFTFMPEIYPGGIVSFPEHGIQCFVDEVHHHFDYATGFVTQANLSAPAALPGSNQPDLALGMIRDFDLTNDQPYDPFQAANAAPKTPAKK